ncbi:MAG: TVP38/TMEM64 family protein [Clostridiales bacterium]|nr:TVP38/TMEM64 family protein [Clostridiales bacterium]
MPFKQRLIITLLSVFISAAIIISAVFLMSSWGAVTQTVIYVLASLFFVCSIVFCIIKKDKLLKSAFVLLLCVAVVYIALVITNNAAGLDRYDTDGEKLSHIVELIKSTGGWGMAVFVVLQILQVLILPLPAVVCYVSGVQIWGPWPAFGLACLGVFIGSTLCFIIGRRAGKRAAYWIAGKETVDKYADIIGSKGKVPFIVMQILPFFPDDILCIIAGLSSMDARFFTVCMLTVRPAVIAVYCFFGSGDIIPFSGWGIPVWIAIFAVCIVAAILSIKYQDKIDAFFKRKFTKSAATAGGGEKSANIEMQPVKNDAEIAESVDVVESDNGEKLAPDKADASEERESRL